MQNAETVLYQLTDIVVVIADVIETKCVFLYIEGAFNSTSHTEMQDALIWKGVRNTLAF